MNKTFKILWNEVRRCYIVANETQKTHGKPSKAAVLAVAVTAALGASAAYAGGYVLLPGARLLPAEALALPEIYRRGRAVEYTPRAAAGMLDAAREAGFAVADELGGPALADAGYYDAAMRLLFAGTPAVGVLRTADAPEAELRELLGALEKDADTLILQTGGAWDINACGALRHWAAEYALPPKKRGW